MQASWRDWRQWGSILQGCYPAGGKHFQGFGRHFKANVTHAHLRSAAPDRLGEDLLRLQALQQSKRAAAADYRTGIIFPYK